MNLLVSCMGYDGGKSGISAYMRETVARLARSGHAVTLVVEAGSENDFDAPQCPRIVVGARWSRGALGFLWHLFVLPRYARRRAYDVLLILAANRRYAIFKKIPAVGVVHDLSQYRVARKYDALRMFYLTKLQPYLGRGLSAAVAISETTRRDIIRHWKLPANRVFLNYNGLTRRPNADDGVLKKYGLARYVLYVSRIEHPGKNHIGLIRAFERLSASARGERKLVFAGGDWSGAEFVKAAAKASPCADRIVFTGYVSDAEIAGLYRNAEAFVFPSFSEGFGLPLVEAMACGVPCACSAGGALEEVGGDAVLTFDPHHADGIARALETLLTDAGVRAALKQKGFARADFFSWDRHVETLLTIARKCYDKNSRLEIFGIPFVNGRMNDTVRALTAAACGEAPRQKVAFINTHYLNSAYADVAQCARLRRFDKVLPDGSGVSLACRILGYRYRDNLNGTDLLPRLCEACVARGLSIYFFGGREGVAQRAVENLKKRFPTLKVAGFRNGYFKPEESADIVADINRANPDFLCVGFGVKLQEAWVDENFEKLSARVVLAIGGVCDVYSGDLFRVHPVLRRLGLEWVGRLWQDPVRLFGRYVVGNPLFLWRVFCSRFRRKTPRGNGADA